MNLMNEIRDEHGKIMGVERNPLVVQFAGGTAPGDGSGGGTGSAYPKDVVLIADTTSTATTSGSYTATDNVTVTLTLSDTNANSNAVFTAYLKYGAGNRIQTPGIRITGSVDEVATAGPNTIVQYGVAAGYTLILEVTRTSTGTVSAKGTVSL